MRTASQLLNMYTSLTQNISADNQTLGLELLSEEHRQLIETYFDNEWSFQATTVGAQTLTLTALPAAGATSATLSAVWAYSSGQQDVTFTNPNGDVRPCFFTNNSATISWQLPLSGACTTTSITTFGFQKYKIPAGISKITNNTIMVGQMRFVPSSARTRSDWDRINFLPYTSDIVNYYFLYGGFVEFWPIPSTTGNTIQFNYKRRVPDFSSAFLFSDTNGTAYVPGQKTYDYQKGQVQFLTAGTNQITGVNTAWNTTGQFPLTNSAFPFNLGFIAPPPNGDGIWYPIQEFDSDTSLTLASAPMYTIGNSNSNYMLGQLPLLQEDFHEMIVYGAVRRYFSSYVPDPNKYEQFDKLYQEKKLALAEYNGSKIVNYNLGDDQLIWNPNSYYWIYNSNNI